MRAIALGFFGFTMLRRLAPLGALRRETRSDRIPERIAALLAFGLGQRRLVDPEERAAGLLHVLVFGAFVVLALRTVTLFGMGFAGPGFYLPLLSETAPLGRAYLLAKDLMAPGAPVGAAGSLWPRLVPRPDRVTLSTEGVVILLFIAGLMVTDMLFDASRMAGGAAAGWLAPAGALAELALDLLRVPASAVQALGTASFWIHLALILVFLNVLPYGKHFHILTALPNVFFRRLPPEGALRRLDLEAEDASYGAATVKDLSWKEAWDVYSCTECGRCQTHCPTYVTGKPLSHKEVNRTIRRHLREVAPALVALAIRSQIQRHGRIPIIGDPADLHLHDGLSG